MKLRAEVEALDERLRRAIEAARRAKKSADKAVGGPVTYLSGRRVIVPGSGEGDPFDLSGPGDGAWNGPPSSNANQPPGGGG